jgi:hypothetical protein
MDRPFTDKTEAAESPLFFLELWNNVAFYDTNLEKVNFSAILGRFEGKAGINIFHYPLQAYGVYYGAASQSDDYYNNYIFSGGGLRVIPLRDFEATSWYNEWLRGVKFYYEDLSASYLKNAASAEGLAKTDTRYGVEIWHEWNLTDPDFGRPWGELWLKLAYHDTNFGWEPFGTQVLYYSPKIGLHLTRDIQVYLKADVTDSSKEGPKYSFMNIADYGIGLRFVPWQTVGHANDLLRKFKMFAEVLGVKYLADEPVGASNVVDSDVRFGVEFSYGR